MSDDPGPGAEYRYARHLSIDVVGGAGQERIQQADVLVVGAGGLGSPVIAYLAAAGVGTLHIVDPDIVETSNLQRQVIHTEADVGRPKVDSAKAFVESLNSEIEVHTHEAEFGPENAESLVADRDVVVDCTDNFRARYVINDACTLAGVPFVHGAVYRLEGQIGTFGTSEDGPCYRCLFPEAPPEEATPDCAVDGVLSPLPGTIGTMEATEVLKAVAEFGEQLDGRLLVYDGEDMTTETLPMRQNPDCPVCGEHAEIDSVAEIEYTHPFSIE
ncbi:HesA/MoeB/ThiF family protein [Halodesulfurarchaeum sp. HSR-GB]|uniref:HesA/MoeB/ThiF family protein n=1 Tax=Halodesulfurarchaeum sp. HSR-GB TaxID=3074077 RepID=UPI00285F9B74|nr:HesA/MoeB/ThiF family protein [Halodesulfurarchaeum sp. HSR-GB]MDR5655907.1 HesA/MoeB/ThiF family protein [Halodesulfurarchaeum sp. HSR-GB]